MTKHPKRVFSEDEKDSLRLVKRAAEARSLIKCFKLITNGHKVKIIFKSGKIRYYNVDDFLF